MSRHCSVGFSMFQKYARFQVTTRGPQLKYSWPDVLSSEVGH